MISEMQGHQWHDLVAVSLLTPLFWNIVTYLKENVRSFAFYLRGEEWQVDVRDKRDCGLACTKLFWQSAT